MKTLDELIEFLNVNVKVWKEELTKVPEFEASRKGAIQCCELIGKFLDGELDPPEAPVSETDAEEQAAEESKA